MNFAFVVLSLAVAVAKATPVEPGYGVPAAIPIQQVTLPVAPPVVAPVPVAPRVLPLAPAPVRIFSQSAVLPAAPVPLGPAVVRSAAPVPVPFAPVAPVTAGRLAFARSLPAPLAAAPVPVARALPAPLPLVRSPVAALAPAVVPAAVPLSQFHAQDEFGGFNFGYQGDSSARQEIRTPDGVTTGSYSYLDANGITQTVKYVADPVNGFRVAATNLPVAPVGPAVAGLPVVANAAPVIAPVPVAETPEVLAARQEFQIAFDAAVARAEAEAAGVAAAEAGAISARKKREAIAPGYGVPAAPVVPVVPVPAPLPVVPAPAPVPVAVATGVPDLVAVQRSILPVGPAPVLPLGRPVARSFLPVPAPIAPLARTVVPVPVPFAPAARSILPVAPAPIVPGPARVIPAAAAQVRVPLTASVAPAPVPAPVLVRTAPAVIPTPVTTQFREEDGLGSSAFGFSTVNQARQEVRNADGSTTGSYSYVDANGVLQTVNYVADALGFRVAASNLPVAPAAPVAPVVVA